MDGCVGLNSASVAASQCRFYAIASNANLLYFPYNVLGKVIGPRRPR
jgi:hypothetical protein